MSTSTNKERASGEFDGYVATPADYEMYAKYSTVRLRLLAWLGDPVAKKILASR
jgi:hypothetical protein